LGSGKHNDQFYKLEIDLDEITKNIWGVNNDAVGGSNGEYAQHQAFKTAFG